MTNALALKGPEQFLTGALGNFDAYVERVSQIPVLGKEEEIELAQRIGLPIPRTCLSRRPSARTVSPGLASGPGSIEPIMTEEAPADRALM